MLYMLEQAKQIEKKPIGWNIVLPFGHRVSAEIGLETIEDNLGYVGRIEPVYARP